MNGGVSKAQTPRPHPEPSKAAQEKLLDAASTGAGLLQSLRELSPGSGGLARDEPSHSTKRRLDTTHPLPAAKRARLEETEAQQPKVEDEEPEQPAKTTLQQPKPKPPKRLYASFLEDCVDPGHPRPAPKPVSTFVSEWLESVDREKRSRSDSHLHLSDDGSIPRQLTISAPEMAYTRDADGFAVPPTPNSYAGSAVSSDLTGATPGSGRSSGRSFVEDPLYRGLNLAANGVYMRSSREQVPEYIANLLYDVGKDRDSPGPSADYVWQDMFLEELENGAGEPKVEKYFQTAIFPDPEPADNLERTDRQPMVKHAVPGTGSKLKLSTPVPDMLYGYSRHAAFPHQQAQLISIGAKTVANSQGLIYPFFVIEIKADGPTGVGSLWVATNQCLGGSTSCVNIAERLNHQLRKCKSDKIRTVNSAAFSIAISGTEARLYILWKHSELDYYMQKIKSFLLSKTWALPRIPQIRPEYYQLGEKQAFKGNTGFLEYFFQKRAGREPPRRRSLANRCLMILQPAGAKGTNPRRAGTSDPTVKDRAGEKMSRIGTRPDDGFTRMLTELSLGLSRKRSRHQWRQGSKEAWYGTHCAGTSASHPRKRRNRRETHFVGGR